MNFSLELKQNYFKSPSDLKTAQRGAFCQFPFRIYYYCSNESTGKETEKTTRLKIIQTLVRHPVDV